MSYENVSIAGVDHGLGGTYQSNAPISIDVVVINNNPECHLLPLLYKVSLDFIVGGTTSLEITNKLRSQKNPFIMLGEVTGINKHDKKIYLESGDVVLYNHLIEVCGLKSSCFDDYWRDFVPGVEVLYDSLKMRKTFGSCLESCNKDRPLPLVDKDIQICKKCLRIAIEENLKKKSVSSRHNMYITKNKTFQIEV